MKKTFTFHRYEDKKRLEDKFSKFSILTIIVTILPLATLIYQFTQNIFMSFLLLR